MQVRISLFSIIILTYSPLRLTSSSMPIWVGFSHYFFLSSVFHYFHSSFGLFTSIPFLLILRFVYFNTFFTHPSVCLLQYLFYSSFGLFTSIPFLLILLFVLLQYLFLFIFFLGEESIDGQELNKAVRD